MARFKYFFWLNDKHADEILVMDTIAELKRKRLFTPTLRDGIMLIVELRQGKTDLLVKLFPWIEKAFGAPAVSEPDDELKREIRQMKDLLLARGVNPANEKLLDKPGPKPLGGFTPRPTTRIDDDDDDVIEIKKSDGKESVENFLKSAMALQ